ncbi:hypothetical protein V1460_16525 [Streptomyces sp. SCSIO 30461]|uniref:hypothetical protein n=1 Tax=Streptomyces sp. SCSIO 30461 TaxID=3118085 RepID=UPI0030D434CD
MVHRGGGATADTAARGEDLHSPVAAAQAARWAPPGKVSDEINPAVAGRQSVTDALKKAQSLAEKVAEEQR